MNDIISYSKANLDRQVKNMIIRHAPAAEPLETGAFPNILLPRQANTKFYGRQDELEKIDRYLNWKRSDTGLRTYTIYGRRGVGKTEIAAQYAHTNPAGFDAVFWIQCETSIALRQSFTDVAISLGLPGADKHGQWQSSRQVGNTTDAE